ncbi:hypothetical protein F5I97DRAFT_1867629 [Phlebopus sp. FC_14]|nr:hypothetical protein F5I97DRAFT_1880162 [Phlebopus sp. FC_14]KAH7886515.1 hypothetical protein F5I97DRAFT_1867629 [Phlebopus sp. FC_14]
MPADYRWRPSRKRSQKENTPPILPSLDYTPHPFRANEERSGQKMITNLTNRVKSLSVSVRNTLRREKRAKEKLAAVKPRVTDAEVSRMKVTEIDLQLRWHRGFDPLVPRPKDLPKNKAEKVVVLLAAVGRYRDGDARPDVDMEGNNEDEVEVEGAGLGASSSGEED